MLTIYIYIYIYVCICTYSEVKVAQSCTTFCDSMYDTVHGILQARILEWVLSLLQGNLPNPGIKARSLALQADSLPAEPPGKPMCIYG